MALYYNGDYVSSINFTPQMTLSEYNALEIKPKYWIRTDAPESGTISANDIGYSTGVTVKDAIDSIDTNLSDKLLITDGDDISDLNIPINDLPPFGIYRGKVSNETSHHPATGGASSFTITNSESNYWGRQLFISDGGIYTRDLSNGTYGNWKQLDNMDKLTNETTQRVYNSSTADSVNYIRGWFNTTQTTTLQSRILDFISQITTGGYNTVFDVIIVGTGGFHFSGYIYNNKKYAAGTLEYYGGAPLFWRRYDDVDYFYNYTITPVT